MNRRSRRARPVARIVMRPWSDGFKTVFQLAGDAWTPPAYVRVRFGARSWTLTADFRDEDGRVMQLKTRVGLGADGRPETVQEQTLTIVSILRGAKR